MILPDKNIKMEYSLLNCGAIVLFCLSEPKTISLLWDAVRTTEQLINYERFILTLDFLFTISAISIEEGFIVRGKNDSFN